MNREHIEGAIIGLLVAIFILAYNAKADDSSVNSASGEQYSRDGD